MDKFRSIDVDRSGALDKDEVALMAEQLGFKLTVDELNTAIKEMDLDGDGEVTFDEFVAWWNNDEAESEIASKLKDNIGLSSSTLNSTASSGLPLG